MGWVLGFRLFLTLLLLIRAGLLWPTDPSSAFLIAIGVLIAVLVTANAGYMVLVRRMERRMGGLFLQSFVDLMLVTALVHFGGESATALAALYVVVIASYGLLLPVSGGIMVALLSSGAYLADAVWVRPRELPPGLLGQIVVFGFVFLLVVLLGHRLRDTAAQQTRLESELRRVRFEADEILRSIRTGVITVDGQGCLGFINPTAERLLEIDGHRRTGLPVLELLLGRAPVLHDAIVDGLRRGVRVSRGEGIVTRADGHRFPIGLSTATFDREGEMVPAVTAVFTDLSELKQLQELHLRADRLEAVAALSASLAHEIRNPLASIRSSVEQLALSAQADPDERVLGQLIVRESDRLTRLLSEFLDFSRVRAANFRMVDLHAVAVETARLVREHPDCGPDIVLVVQGSSTPVEADEDLLHRIVSNLLLNAVQACRGVGRITVTVGGAPARELPPGSGLEDPVRLVVEDDGPGIDPELRERLFQPFVSGRPGGSGLGLAIVQRAVEAHRGLVTVDSTPGPGARFTVYLRSRLFQEDAA
jgi:two-component system sensor histidine kinase PilS (NtrC family)